MSRKHFSWLLIVTAVVAVVVLLLPGRTGQESGYTRAPFLPELQAQVNELDWLRIRGAGGTVVATLERADDHWRVAEAHAYRADWERLRTLLSELAQAEIVEAKTDNPAYYDRLGVEDVTAPAATGLQIEFAEGTGLPAVIVGKRAEGRGGHYARRADAAASALLDRNLDLPAAAKDWLATAIVDIADDEVVEVAVVHPDGERVTARKASADDEHFELQNIPEGREIRSAWTVDSLANALSALSLEAVAPQDDVDWNDAVQFALVTADGLRVEVEGVATGLETAADEAAEAPPDVSSVPAAEHWIRLQAGLYQTVLDSAVEAPATGDVEAGGGDDAATAVDPTERAAEINRRVSGWAYRIPKYKYDAMSKRLEDLLQAPPGDDE
ncbi:MAG: DUF4340 domain-containing protein [Xanthomonadales bacterium]|nr:DUF4340 domain-containing protein [Xanthomonadales bacterium]